jgi:Niemann-Pick C1 protein
MGMMVIALSLGASFGFCFYMGIYFADMHPVIPFLLLGIGVDDMYVIVQVRIVRK